MAAGFGDCKRDGDQEPPVITVSAPNEGRIYQVTDIIHISAIFRDNERLTSVKLTLMDAENRPALPSVSLEPSTKQYTLTSDYPIDNPELKSGIYELDFQASDGFNTTNVFVKISLVELPRVFSYPVIVTRPQPAKLNVFRLSESGDWAKIFSQQGDYAGSAVNSHYQQFYLSGASDGNLTAWNLKDNFVIWSKAAEQLPDGQWFESLSYLDPLLYVSYHDGSIKAFDKTGTTAITSEIVTPYFPVKTSLSGNYLAAALHSTHDQGWALGIYYSQSGKLKAIQSPAPEIRGIYPLDTYRLLTFGNLWGNGSVNLYDLRYDQFTDVKLIPGDTLFSISAMDTDNYFISGLHGVYWFRYSDNSLVEFAACSGKARLACEDLNREVFIGAGKKLLVYSFPDGILQQILNVPDSILDVHLLYNK